eukprot:2587339-Prymnesium_polylepis.2
MSSHRRNDPLVVRRGGDASERLPVPPAPSKTRLELHRVVQRGRPAVEAVLQPCDQDVEVGGRAVHHDRRRRRHGRLPSGVVDDRRPVRRSGVAPQSRGR